MPVASGSIAFLGAARFQGYWDASTNTGTGSIYGGISGEKLGLFETGSSPGAGYQVETGLTASKGDYWQITGSGTHNVDGETGWQLNDFCVFSGSVSRTSRDLIKPPASSMICWDQSLIVFE